MRTCPFHQCTAKLPDHRFACRTHWYQLQLNQRWRINDAYAAYLRDEIDIERLRQIQQEVLGDRGAA